MTSMLLVTAACLVLILWGWVWRLRWARRWIPSGERGRGLSLVLALIPFYLFAIVPQNRGLAALDTQGLSHQDAVLIAVTMVAGVWALFLVLTRQVRPVRFILGPPYWVSVLVVVYGLSTLWSVWPSYTAFRSVQLGINVVLAVHVFSGRDWRKWLDRFLLFAILGDMVAKLMELGFGVLVAGPIFAALRENYGSMLSAALVVRCVHAGLFERRKFPAVRFLVGLLGLTLFGSMASIVAGVICVGLLLALKARYAQRAWLLTAGFVLISGFGAWALTRPTQFEQAATPVATLFGKASASVVTLTGRVPLWSALIRTSGDKPFGEGYTAGERLLLVTHQRADAALSWPATNAHNGYISAWISAGWLGILPLAFVLLAILERGAQLDRSRATLVLALLALLVINNVTTVALGGKYNMGWLLTVALCCVPGARFDYAGAAVPR